MGRRHAITVTWGVTADALARARTVADELPVAVDVDELVNGRAALLGLVTKGRTSAGGTCRLLRTTDSWIAVNLARPCDVDALPAVLEVAVDPDDPWPAVERYASARAAIDVADRFQLLGVAAAALDDPTVDASRAVIVHEFGRTGSPSRHPVVVDLSSMWAGPLCAHLLGRADLGVIKVESVHRPDGARAGDPRFFDWLHDGHESVVLDFHTAAGREALRDLIERADVVIEASRPRALAQLGIAAAEVVGAAPGRTWVSITGYGRHGAAADKIAFGDDAAVAGGLVEYDADGAPAFYADAIADPMSGLFAAAAAFRSIAAGGGHLVEVAMAAVAKSVAAGA